MDQPIDEIEVMTRAKALYKLHQLLRNYPDGIETSTLLRLFASKYPQFKSIEVESLLNTLSGTMLQARMAPYGDHQIVYPLSVYWCSPAKLYAAGNSTLGEIVSGANKQSAVLKVQVVHVGSANSFFVYLPGGGQRLSQLISGMSEYYEHRRVQSTEGEDIELGSFYACRSPDGRYVRVRTEYICESAKDSSTRYTAIENEPSYRCTLIDFGGEVTLKSREFLRLPSWWDPHSAILDTDPENFEFFPFALKCTLPLNEIICHPLTREELYYCLIGRQSGGEGRVFVSPLPHVMVRFLRFDEEKLAFIAYPITDDGANELLSVKYPDFVRMVSQPGSG